MSNRLRRTILLVVSLIVLLTITFLVYGLFFKDKSTEIENNYPKPKIEKPKEPIEIPDSQRFHFI